MNEISNDGSKMNFASHGLIFTSKIFHATSPGRILQIFTHCSGAAADRV